MDILYFLTYIYFYIVFFCRNRQLCLWRFQLTETKEYPALFSWTSTFATANGRGANINDSPTYHVMVKHYLLCVYTCLNITVNLQISLGMRLVFVYFPLISWKLMKSEHISFACSNLLVIPWLVCNLCITDIPFTNIHVKNRGKDVS